MAWVIKVIANEWAGIDFPRPTFIQAFDLDFMDGIGKAVLTEDVGQALTFPDLPALMNAWRATSAVRPVRPDGKPNRPLTAFTIEPVNLDSRRPAAGIGQVPFGRA